MPGPLAALAPLASGGTAGVAGSAGVAKIAAAAGMLSAAGGAAFTMKGGASSPSQLSQKLLTTAMLDAHAVSEKASRLAGDAGRLRGRNPLIGIAQDLVIDVAGNAIGRVLGDWISDFINNEKEILKVDDHCCRGSDSLTDINDRCGAEVDSIGSATLTAVMGMLQALAVVNPAVNPLAYKKGLDVIARYIADASRIADQCIDDRDNTMADVIEMIIAFVESQISAPFNRCFPDDNYPPPWGPDVTPEDDEESSPESGTDDDTTENSGNKGSGVTGGSSVGGGGGATAGAGAGSAGGLDKAAALGQQPPVAESPSDTPGRGALGGAMGSSASISVGAMIGKEIGAAVQGFLQQLVTPAAMDASYSGSSAVLNASAPGVVGSASLAGVASIVGAVGEEISKFINQAAHDVHNTIESFREQALAACEPAQQEVTQCEPEVEPVVETADCESDTEVVTEKPAQEPVKQDQEQTPVTEKGFDKSSLKPSAETQPASATGFDKSSLKEGPAAPTVNVAPPATGSSATSSVSAKSTVHLVGEW